MNEAAPDFIRVLEVLVAHDIEFVVVGGVCAVLQGVPVTTIDLDIVHHRTDENVTRLLLVLDELDASSRLDRRGIRPNRSHLMSERHQLLRTNAGLLDILGAIAGGEGYTELLERTEKIQVAGGAVHILTLEKLAEVKERTGRPKDLMALTLIRHTIQEKKR